jgi:hypothetical protein
MKTKRGVPDRLVWTRGNSRASEMEPVADEDGRRNGQSLPSLPERFRQRPPEPGVRASTERGSPPAIIVINYRSINSLPVLRQKLAKLVTVMRRATRILFSFPRLKRQS